MASLPKFARVDVEIEGGGTPTQPPPAPTPSIVPRTNKRRATSSFGAIDMDSIGIAPYERPQPFVPKPQETPTRQNIEAVKVAAQATRPSKAKITKPKITKPRISKPKMGAAGAKISEAITKPRVDLPSKFKSAMPERQKTERPTRESMEAVKIAEDETRIAKAGSADLARDRAEALAARIDAALQHDDDSGESGVAPSSSSEHDDPVAVMRELYAQGNADAALAIATGLGLGETEDDDFPVMKSDVVQVEITGGGGGGGGATTDFEFDDLEAPSDLMASGDIDCPDLDDPFGGLIPVQSLAPAAGPAPTDDNELIACEPEEFEAMPSSSEPDPFGGLLPADDNEVPDHTAIVASTARIPRLLISPREISKLPVDPRAAFILGHVDGIQSIEEILDICAMPAPEAVELIEKLRALGVISLS